VCREAVAVRAVAPAVEEKLRAQGAWELATTLEFPLIPVLARMEHTALVVETISIS
jgi:DNA polymerase I-like protein with 3'-5' exonuclease and polymerase domains